MIKEIIRRNIRLIILEIVILLLTLGIILFYMQSHTKEELYNVIIELLKINGPFIIFPTQ